MNKGFVAVTAVVIVGSILLCLVVANSLESSTFFDMTLKKEYRFINYHNAGNCIDLALLELSHDYFFTTSEPVRRDYFDCSIMKVEAVGDLRYIETRGDLMKAYVYRRAIARLSPTKVEFVSKE